MKIHTITNISMFCYTIFDGFFKLLEYKMFILVMYSNMSSTVFVSVCVFNVKKMTALEYNPKSKYFDYVYDLIFSHHKRCFSYGLLLRKNVLEAFKRYKKSKPIFHDVCSETESNTNLNKQNDRVLS